MDIEIPAAWAELIEGLTILAKRAGNTTSPLHCEHDTLTVLGDPARCTGDELSRLSELGFEPDDEGYFYSFKFGSA